MNLKYAGEAIALLGIAYSIMRWIGRNVSETDARPQASGEIELGVGSGAVGTRRVSVSHAESQRPERGEPGSADPVPAPPPDAAMLDGAAAMFGITRDALIAMDPRERTLLLSGYQAAQRARRSSGNG
jgi:hypothetical protein